MIPDRFAGVKVWEKPFDEFKLARDVVAILSTRGLVRTRELTGFLSLHICYSGAGTDHFLCATLSSPDLQPPE